MFSWLWTYRKIILTMTLAGVLFFTLKAQRKDEEDYNIFDRFLIKMSAPIQSAISHSIDFFHSISAHYIQNTHASKENQILRSQLLEAQRQILSLQETYLENRRLLALLHLAERSQQVDYIAAHVIGYSTSPLFKSLRINVGAKNGISRGMGVISAQGLIGRIMIVERSYSDVMLLSDSASSIDIFISRSRARGRLRGLGENTFYRARIDYLSRSAQVEIGDKIFTTGAGTVFPKGVLVGHVISINKVEHGLYQEAIIEPAAALNSLDEILVVKAFTAEAQVAKEDENLTSIEEDSRFSEAFALEKELYPELYPSSSHIESSP